jgi:hypothetical protein
VMSSVSRVRTGLIAVGLATYIVLAVAILAAGRRFAVLGPDYSAQAWVAFALPVGEGLLLLTLFTAGRKRRFGMSALGMALAGAVWGIVALDVIFVAFSSAAAP